MKFIVTKYFESRRLDKFFSPAISLYHDVISQLQLWPVVYWYPYSSRECAFTSCDGETGGRVGRSRYKLPGPDNVAYVFIFIGSIIICRLHKLNLTDKAQVTLQLRVSVSDLVMWYKVGSPLWGARKTFFTGARTRSRRSSSQVL